MSEFLYKHQKLFTAMLAVVFIISLIPMFIIAGFDAAAGDDYNFGANAHLTYLATGSVIAAIKAALETTVGVWHGWQGTWFDCFLFCLHPEVFSDSAYTIVPYLFIAMQCAAFLLFAHHFLKVRWKMGGLYWLEIGLLFLLFAFQLVPSQKSAFFWWVGSIHYAMPMCMALTGLVTGDRFLIDHKISDFIILTIIAALMGGATYPAALLLILGVFLLWLAHFVLEKKKNLKDLFLLIPLILEIIGLIISMIAPGNAIRSASDLKEGAVPSGGPIATVFKSIIFSVTDALTYFIAEKTFVLIAVIIIGIVSFSALKHAIAESANNDMVKLFSHPLLFALVMFLLNASMYAPRLYAGGIVSSGYFNFNFEVFFICLVGTVIYLLGWILSRKQGTGQKSLLSSKPLTIAADSCLILLILIIAFVGRHGVKTYTDYVCMEYYLTGQAADYKEQIALQRRLMEEPGVDDVILPGINNEQGPLMHMPVVADPDNIDNKMTCNFYGKRSCRAIPRTEWMEKYGEKYGY